MKLIANAETWKLARPFTISRGSRTDSEVVVVTLEEDGIRGRGECTPYSRYGESIEETLAELRQLASLAERGRGIETILAGMKPGAPRNALDCAWWDWRCKRSGRRIAEVLQRPPLREIVTAYTVSLGEPRAMEEVARENADRPLLKIKTGGEEVVECVEAVRRGAPESVLVVDANEAWHADQLASLLEAMAALGVAFVEQPLPWGEDGLLGEIKRPIPVFADESFHTAADIASLAGRYDGVNIKLDKTGGFSEALQTLRAAREHRMAVLCGCMLGTSLAMAPAMVIAQEADYVDLDAPLLFSEDRPEGIVYRSSAMRPFSADLWG